MARREVEPKRPGRVQRAEAVKAATSEEWQARTGGRLEKTGSGGLRLVAAKAPDYIYDADGEIIGVDAWVQLFDEQGRELPIDPHRRIINPPTVPMSGVRLGEAGRPVRDSSSEGRPAPTPVVERRIVGSDPAAAFWEAVWQSVERAPNPKGWRTRGTVTSIFADAEDGYVDSADPTYSTARSGNFQEVNTSRTDAFPVGQGIIEGWYFCWEGFVSFDTSAISDSDTVSAVQLQLYEFGTDTNASFTVEARQRDWGATLDAGDWVAGASLGSSTLMASHAVASGQSEGSKTFTSEAAFLTATNLKTGFVRLLLNSSRHRAGNTPTGYEVTYFLTTENSGTSLDPTLHVTHSGGGSSPFFTSRPNRIWRLG